MLHINDRLYIYLSVERVDSVLHIEIVDVDCLNDSRHLLSVPCSLNIH